MAADSSPNSAPAGIDLDQRQFVDLQRGYPKMQEMCISCHGETECAQPSGVANEFDPALAGTINILER